MKKVLCINAHPLFTSEQSVSNQVMAQTIAHLQGASAEVEVLNLFDMEVPCIDSNMMELWMKGPQNDEQKHMAEVQAKLLAQFKSADLYIISSPLYNFSPPSRFKDYFDNVVIAKETFEYTPHGPKGLLKDKSAIYIQGSGSIYTRNYHYISLDVAPHYVGTLLHFMGINKIEVVRAEGTNFGGQATIIECGAKQAIDAVDKALAK